MNHIPFKLQNLHISRFDEQTYQMIIQKKHLKEENISDLYQLNMIISQEFYIILHTIETLFKYKLHEKLSELYGTPNWVNLIQWQKMQSMELHDAAKFLPRHFYPEQLLDNLNFGFWVHLLDPEYNNSIFHPAITKIFPNYPNQRELTRPHIKKILTEALNRRNSIAHSILIIHEERKLLKDFRQFMQLIYWLDENYYQMIKTHLRFKKYYRILVTSSYSRRGYIFYFFRRFRRLFFMCLWFLFNLIGKIFNIKRLP